MRRFLIEAPIIVVVALASATIAYVMIVSTAPRFEPDRRSIEGPRAASYRSPIVDLERFYDVSRSGLGSSESDVIDVDRRSVPVGESPRARLDLRTPRSASLSAPGRPTRLDARAP